MEFRNILALVIGILLFIIALLFYVIFSMQL